MNSSSSVSESTSFIKSTVQGITNFVKNNFKLLLISALVAAIGFYIIKKYVLNKSTPTTEPVQQTETPSVEGFDDGTNTLRIFHVDWCGHCKKMVPEFNKLMELPENDEETEEKELNFKNKSVKLVKVNPEKSTSGEELAKKFNVQGYPTIVLTTGGKDIQYEGGPSADSLKTFLESNL